MKPTLRLTLLTLTVVLAATPAAAQTYFDGDMQVGWGGTSAAAFGVGFGTGGNQTPENSYRLHSFGYTSDYLGGASYGFSFTDRISYTPLVDGPLLPTSQLSIQARVEPDPGRPGQTLPGGVFVGMALRQGDSIYIAGDLVGGSGTAWQTTSATLNEFSRFSGTGPTSPNFTNGVLIAFGYFAYTNAGPPPGFSYVAGAADNFSVNLIPVPEPAGVLAAAVGLAARLRRRG